MRIGTRRSALAVAQAQLVADALGGGELVEITTSGDRGAPGGDKARWTGELERALLEDEIDVAVHSAKDVPVELGEGLEIVAVPTRADVRDALVGTDSLDSLPAGARVGTSSLRRASQLLAARGDLEIVGLRGNVDSRLRKLGDGDCDALVLAVAGLARLGREDEIGAALDVEAFVPAPGQGALALEARAGDGPTVRALAGLDDAEAHRELLAERALTRGIGASCHTPVGAHAHEGVLTAYVGLPDGSAWVRDRVEGDDDPEALGRRVAGRLLAAGASELLRAAEELA